MVLGTHIGKECDPNMIKKGMIVTIRARVITDQDDYGEFIAETEGRQFQINRLSVIDSDEELVEPGKVVISTQFHRTDQTGVVKAVDPSSNKAWVVWDDGSDSIESIARLRVNPMPSIKPLVRQITDNGVVENRVKEPDGPYGHGG
jgi:hypothetical protein